MVGKGRGCQRSLPHCSACGFLKWLPLSVSFSPGEIGDGLTSTARIT